MTELLRWDEITSRKGARVLQHFTCTTDRPRSPAGRTLPHEQPWEWEAQRHIRQLSALMQPEDIAMLAYAESDIAACAHLQFELVDTTLQVFVAAVGVSQPFRHHGGRVADQVLARVLAGGLARSRTLPCTHVALVGKIHVRNVASLKMVERAGWEAIDVPRNDYQSWALVVAT